MFDNQPKGLYALALANTGERFGYYTMLAVFALFLRANFGLSAEAAGYIYSGFLAFVYFLPLIGGIVADKIGYGKCVTIGIIIMFLGYVLLAVPLGGVESGNVAVAMSAMLAALVLISFGTGLFKGNLQVMVGNLYDDPKYADRRDAAFSLFYMAINIGAMFAPTAAVKIMAWAQESLGYSVNDSYHFAFMVACASLVLSIAIYYACRPWFKHVENTAKQQAAAGGVQVEPLSPEQTKKRMVALFMVFAVVIFFWMAFHQNGLTLTYFANEFVTPVVTGVQTMAFDIINLVLVAILVYALFGVFGKNSQKSKTIWGCVGVAVIGALAYKYFNHPAELGISAPIFQQFNPFYVVALTPISMAVFGALAAKGKEPSAPRKIAYGMVVAALAYVFIAACSLNLNSPAVQATLGLDERTLVNPNVLIFTYLILTFAELLLSPMGISFVSKVAPPQYKGMMMGFWFVATAVGNFLVSVGSALWEKLPLWGTWSVFIGVCAVSALFMFAMMRKLEDATK